MSPTDTKRIQVSTYMKRLLMRHIGYSVAFVCFVFLLVSFVPLQITQYIQMRKELSQVQSDIDTLSTRQSVIQQYPSSELEDLVLTLNSLYPSVEDRFSIFTALENIQGITGIRVVTYSSPFAGKTLDEVTIAVKAEADIQSFRRFLQYHVFRSGRLMTIDGIVFDNVNGVLNFSGTFHSKNIQVGALVATQYSPDAITRLREIQRQVDSAGLVRKTTTVEEEVIPIDYSTKSNPFE